jgi:TM2 domain-containing membrane protein YozV
MEECSEKSYVLAVCLSAVFGTLGIHHYYLGRHLEGLLDSGLTICWVYCFFISGQILWGLLALAADFLHSLIVTILLLTGSFRDGTGRLVCYPGQKLNH